MLGAVPPRRPEPTLLLPVRCGPGSRKPPFALYPWEAEWVPAGDPGPERHVGASLLRHPRSPDGFSGTCCCHFLFSARADSPWGKFAPRGITTCFFQAGGGGRREGSGVEARGTGGPQSAALPALVTLASWESVVGRVGLKIPGLEVRNQTSQDGRFLKAGSMQL